MCIASLISYIPLLLTAAATAGPPVPDVSSTRVAYVIGRPFINEHDRYGECVSFTRAVEVPNVYGHEPISVGLGCSQNVRVSAVMAAIAWISAHGETDATVVISREHRGHSAVEAALQALRYKGLTVPQHLSVPDRGAGAAFQPVAMLAGAAVMLFILAGIRLIRCLNAHRVLRGSQSMPNLPRKRSRSVPIPVDFTPTVVDTRPPRHSSGDAMQHKQLWRHTPYNVGVDHMVHCGHADRSRSAAPFQRDAGSPRVPCV